MEERPNITLSYATPPIKSQGRTGAIGALSGVALFCVALFAILAIFSAIFFAPFLIIDLIKVHVPDALMDAVGELISILLAVPAFWLAFKINREYRR